MFQKSIRYLSSVIPVKTGDPVYNYQYCDFRLDSRLLTKGQSPFGRRGNDKGSENSSSKKQTLRYE